MRVHPLSGPLLLIAICATLSACAPTVPRAPQRGTFAGAGAATPTPGPAPAVSATASITERSPPAAPTSVPGESPGEQTVTLHVGESADLGAAGASVSFDRVVEDSRCPANARCIWPGRVVVAGTLRHGGQATPFTLGTVSGIADAPASVEVGPYRLRIADVEPYPATPAGIDEDAYALSLQIEQAPQPQEAR